MTVRDARLATLFLRSRQTGPISIALAAVAIAAGLGLAASNSDDLNRFLRMVVPLAVAVVIGAGAGSPFGEAERSASRPLPPVRFGHLVLLLATGAALLALANVAPADGDLGILLRNSAGFVGLSLIGARLLGSGTFWMVPLAYAGAVLADFLVKPDRDASWRWPLQSADDGTSVLITVVLLVAGVAAVAWFGSRDTAEATV